MISPHPSYPPLEMAEAGLRTITNTYADKDLRSRYPDIVSIVGLTADSLAEEIERAVKEMEARIGEIIGRRPGLTPPSPPGAYSEPLAIARLIRRAAAT